MLSVKNISVNISGKDIVKDVSFDLENNEMLMIIGPNGAGKTTLVKAVMQNIKHTGETFLFEQNITEIPKNQLAKKIAVLTQEHTQQFSFTVSEVVSLGRYVYREGFFGKAGGHDRDKIDEAMSITGIYDLKDRSVLTLSGGELQRVFLAQVFAQDPNILILDEPLNHLDLNFQISIFKTLKEWAKGNNRAVIAIVHDLNIAFGYGDKALLMNNGKMRSYGAVKDVLTRGNLSEVYDVDIASWMQDLLRNWQ
jgi:iron complex transport system ATP-binding protein